MFYTHTFPEMEKILHKLLIWLILTPQSCMSFYTEHLLFIFKKILTFWREKELFLSLIKSGAPLRKAVTHGWEAWRGTWTAGCSSPAALRTRRGRGSKTFQSTQTQNQTNKKQWQLSFPYETTDGWCLKHTMRLSPGPQKAFPTPKPEAVWRTGSCWDWEAKFRATVKEWQLEHGVGQGPTA